MRTVHISKHFKKDAVKNALEFVTPAWSELFGCLLNDDPIPEKYRDHALKGDMLGYRDCHLKPDLVLIYKVVDDELRLHRLASHSELFK